MTKGKIASASVLLWIFLITSTPELTAEEIPWNLRPLKVSGVPPAPNWGRTPIDGFILKRLKEKGIKPSIQASRRTLLRRVSFDLTGLPPTTEQIKSFVSDHSADAYEEIVDRLLSSPRYGERWARHWMDVVHFAETHGHDEDAIRENAWPYRDYLIRSFNNDKPYQRFIKEQIAGDILYPDDPWSTVATGFLASGPWDESSQMGIQDGTIDKKIAQYLDRDDMIATTMSTFSSATVHCARCHDHKFDPIPTTDYYALQAVFAGVDRSDRPYGLEGKKKRRRDLLLNYKSQLEAGEVPEDLTNDPETLASFKQWKTKLKESSIRWPLLKSVEAFSGAGAEITRLNDGSFLFSGDRPETDTYRIRGNPGLSQITAVSLEVLTDKTLKHSGPGRQDNGNLHLSEIEIHAGGKILPITRAVANFNQKDWDITKSIDSNPKTAWGIYPKVGQSHRAVFILEEPLEVKKDTTITVTLKQLHGGGHLIGRPRITVTETEVPQLPPVPPHTINLITFLKKSIALELHSLEHPKLVYSVASDFPANGNFKPAGKPRPVHVLERGSIHSPGVLATPGSLSCVDSLISRFDQAEADSEGTRRAALANWLANHNNMLTWRSIANRVWHYHFGRGIVATPNDFGAMGAKPTHPELLDWLANELRANGGSLKWLHRIICNSSVYRQRSGSEKWIGEDPENLLLWRGPRKRLDAESVRDSVLQISGKIDLRMGGPSDRQFHATKGVHVTPNLDYLGFDPDDQANFRRSVYRFIFRTVPDPLMAALDCPDASQLTPDREVSTTPLQALALLNNRFLVRQCEHIAVRLQNESENIEEQINELFELAYTRAATPEEKSSVLTYASKHGLANVCRIIINSSEFLFVN